MNIRQKPVAFGHKGQFAGNRGAVVQVTADGRIDRCESLGVDRRGDGFVAGLAELADFLREGRPLGAKWHQISDSGTRVSYDCGDERVWKHGGTQQLDVDTAEHSVTLNTLGKRGDHSLTASYEPATGQAIARTIQEEFSPHGTAYEALMRDCY